MNRWTRPAATRRLVTSLLTVSAAAAFCAPVAQADNTALVPVLIKGSNADDSGKELSPNHFRIGRDGTVTVNLRWETNNSQSVAPYCHEVSKILNGAGNVVFEREQNLGGGCSYGGGWRARLTGLGNYTYVLHVTNRDTGENFHAELPFDVVLI